MSVPIDQQAISCWLYYETTPTKRPSRGFSLLDQHPSMYVHMYTCTFILRISLVSSSFSCNEARAYAPHKLANNNMIKIINVYLCTLFSQLKSLAVDSQLSLLGHQRGKVHWKPIRVIKTPGNITYNDSLFIYGVTA